MATKVHNFDARVSIGPLNHLDQRDVSGVVMYAASSLYMVLHGDFLRLGQTKEDPPIKKRMNEQW